MPRFRVEVPVKDGSVWTFHGTFASRDEAYLEWLVACQEVEALSECLGRFTPADIVEVGREAPPLAALMKRSDPRGWLAVFAFWSAVGMAVGLLTAACWLR